MISRKNLIKLFEDKIKKKLEVAQSEADTITGLINPFIDLLGYNREEFEEYRREYKAAYLGKKDAVDIALMKGMNNPTVFIEFKKYKQRSYLFTPCSVELICYSRFITFNPSFMTRIYCVSISSRISNFSTIIM